MRPLNPASPLVEKKMFPQDAAQQAATALEADAKLGRSMAIKKKALLSDVAVAAVVVVVVVVGSLLVVGCCCCW